MATINQSKLAEIQSKVKANKSQYNSFGKYHYRSAEDIIEATKKVINPMGFHLIIEDSIIQLGDRYYVEATATISNGIETYSSKALAREEETKKGMDSSQITGSTSSYARKYALNGLLALDDTKDSDATNTHDKAPKLSAEDVQEYVYLLEQISDLDSLKEVWNDLPAEYKSNGEIKRLTNEKKSQLNK